VADQGKWFKLWCSALGDIHLENLELEDWARWLRLGAFTKQHGTDGTLMISDPARGLQTLLRLTDYREVVKTIIKFPNIVITTSPIKWSHGFKKEPVCDGEFLWDWRTIVGGVSTPPEESVEKVCLKRCVFVSFLNWSKYQHDFSTPRVHRKRANETAQEEKRRDVDEKRLEEKRESKSSAPCGAVTDLISLFHLKLTEVLKEKPAQFNGGALGRTLKAALSTHPVEDVKARILAWFASTDPFIVSNGYSPTLFGSKFPLLKGGPIHVGTNGKSIVRLTANDERRSTYPE
jgi:hypothetical protein